MHGINVSELKHPNESVCIIFFLYNIRNTKRVLTHVPIDIQKNMHKLNGHMNYDNYEYIFFLFHYCTIQ